MPEAKAETKPEANPAVNQAAKKPTKEKPAPAIAWGDQVFVRPPEGQHMVDERVCVIPVTGAAMTANKYVLRCIERGDLLVCEPPKANG